LAKRPVGRDRRGDSDDAVAGEQVTDKADAPNVGVAILFAEPQALAQIGADDIPIQYLDLVTLVAKLGFHPTG